MQYGNEYWDHNEIKIGSIFRFDEYILGQYLVLKRNIKAYCFIVYDIDSQKEMTFDFALPKDNYVFLYIPKDL